jgi:hypothetical protein
MSGSAFEASAVHFVHGSPGTRFGFLRGCAAPLVTLLNVFGHALLLRRIFGFRSSAGAGTAGRHGYKEKEAIAFPDAKKQLFCLFLIKNAMSV